MKESPRIFHARSINAILSGSKTQTRRIVKPGNSTVLGRIPNPARSAKEFFNGWADLDFARAWKDGRPDGPCGEYLHVPVIGDERVYRIRSRVEPGDRLWVREALEYEGIENRGVWVYAADGIIIEFPSDDPRVPAMLSWAHHKEGEHCASIHMPRWASRLTLEIKSIRVQRIQEIHWSDAFAEGIVPHMCCSGIECGCRGLPVNNPIHEFEKLWDETNGKCAWARNDWCWVVEFRKVSLQ